MLGLFAAVECGDVIKVGQLLAQLPQEDENKAKNGKDNHNVSKMIDYRRRTALHLAVEHGHEEVVEALLLGRGRETGGERENVIDLLCAKDCAGFTALHLACELGHDKIVARLLAKCPELAYWKANNTGLTCLHLAVIRGHVKVVQLLLANSGCPGLAGMEDFEKRAPLHFAVEYGHEEIAAVLREECAQSQDTDDKFLPHHKIHDNDMQDAPNIEQLLAQLLEDPRDVTNLIDCRQMTALHLAAEHGNEDVLIGYKNIEGFTPLHLAHEIGRNALIHVLGNEASDPHLQLAVRCYHDMVVAEWLARKRPHIADARKMDLLLFALQNGCDTVVAELFGLIDTARDDRSLLELALENGQDVAGVQLLALRPHLLDMKDLKDDASVLHLAAEYGCVKVMEHILTCKPDLIDAEDRDGVTPLSLACNNRHTHPDAVACLLAHGPAQMHETLLWDVLLSAMNDARTIEVLKLLCAHKPDLIAKVEGYTLLHSVFGFRDGDHQQFYSEETMKAVWQLNPQALLTSTYCGTPFEVAVQTKNKVAIELVKGTLSLDEIVAAYGKHNNSECPLLALLEQFSSEPLLASLNKDVTGTVWEYLGLERPNIRPPNKRMREGSAKRSR